MRFFFYGNKDDLRQLVLAFELSKNVVYALQGHFASEHVDVLPSLVNKSLGIAPFGNQVHNPYFLVARPGDKLKTRAVKQIFIVDAVDNPKTLSLNLGGEFQGEAIIMGEIFTMWEKDDEAKSLFKEFSKPFKNLFRKIDGTYVGQGAEAFWNKGWRLTNSVARPSSMDLKLTKTSSGNLLTE